MLAALVGACQVPGQPGEDRDPYRTDASSEDVGDTSTGEEVASPDDTGSPVDGVSPTDVVEVAAPDADVSTGTDAGDATEDAAEAPDGDVGDDGEVVEVPEPVLDCFEPLGRIEGSFCRPCDSEGAITFEVTTTVVDCNGASFELSAQVQPCEDYVLDDVPPGIYFVETMVYSSSFTAEREPHEVVVDAGRTADLHERICKKCGACQQWPRIAVFTGAYDHVEVHFDARGVPYDFYQGDTAANQPDPVRPGYAILDDPSLLADYDALVVDSGNWPAWFADGIDAEPMRSRIDTLRAWVLAGGDLIVTDWAWLWLEAAFPEAITFAGDPPPDAVGRAVPGLTVAPALGAAVPSVTTEVVAPELVDVLGRETVPLRFGRDAWIVPVDTTGEVWLSIPQVTTTTTSHQDVPAMIVWQPAPDAGRVVFFAPALAFQTGFDAETVLHALLPPVETP